MIIERQYVNFLQLINRDPKAKKLFMNAFNKSYIGMDKEERERWFCTLVYQRLYDRDIGWCLKDIGSLVEGFEKLDKEHPYDNGFTYADVNRVEITNQSEDGLTLWLINSFDGIDSIVSIERIGKLAQL